MIRCDPVLSTKDDLITICQNSASELIICRRGMSVWRAIGSSHYGVDCHKWPYIFINGIPSEGRKSILYRCANFTWPPKNSVSILRPVVGLNFRSSLFWLRKTPQFKFRQANWFDSFWMYIFVQRLHASGGRQTCPSLWKRLYNLGTNSGTLRLYGEN